ncbi:reverse transcriptase domain-containing protein [Tanacetum coccineum]
MHTRASNSELVEPLPEPERTVNRRLRRRNKRVPFDQRNNPPRHPRIVYPPILNINYFRHFLDILRNYDPMDDEPMWAADRVVAPTPGSAITIPETAHEFAIKGNHLTLVYGNQFDGRTKTDPHKHIHEFLGICDMFKYIDTENEVVRLMMFPLTGEAKTWLNELNEGTIETWDELRTAFISRFFPSPLFGRLLGEIRAFSQNENESLTNAWLRMKEMLRNCHVLNAAAGDIFLYKTPNQAYQLLEDKVLLKLDWAKNQKSKTSLKKPLLSPMMVAPTPDLDDDDIPMSCEEEFMQTFHNPNEQNKYENPINFDSDDEDDEPTPQPKTRTPKPVTETPLPKPYKPKISYPQRLRKEKMEAQYGKFLKELIRNKHKIEQISAAFLSDESSTMIQNKVPPKLGDLEIFLIPCNLIKTFSCNALAELGASINLMPYSLYANLSLGTLKPTKMSIRLADRLFQYSVGIAKNMLIEVGKFTFPADFVILEMEEDIKQKQLNLGVGTERMIFNIDSAMKHSYSNDDTCFSIDVINEVLEEDFDALLDEGSKILHSINGTLLEEEFFFGFDEFIAMTEDENSESESDTEEPSFEKITINTNYKIKTSLEEPPTDLELKPHPDNLEYVFLEEPSFLPVIISSQLSAQNKGKLVSVLKKYKEAFAWKTTDIPGICLSFCKHKIQLLDDKKPVV